MELLPMDTVFAGEKTRTRVNGTIQNTGGIFAGLSGAELEGYEIHMGRAASAGMPRVLPDVKCFPDPDL